MCACAYLDCSGIFLLLCVAFSLIDVFFVISMGVLVLVLLLGFVRTWGLDYDYVRVELWFLFFFFFPLNLNYLFACNLCVDTIADIIHNRFYGTIYNFLLVALFVYSVVLMTVWTNEFMYCIVLFC